MQKVFVVINEASHNSWSEFLWSEIADKATIYLDNNDIKNRILKKIKKLHFSNRANRSVWLPFKSIWDRHLVVKLKDLNPNDDNLIIFQSNVKFSPHFIEKLKRKFNCRIVLYLPDTVSKLGIGCDIKTTYRYICYYQIDRVYSFDMNDCSQYGFEYFDLYSKCDIEKTNQVKECLGKSIFYVGNCRSLQRLQLLYSIYLLLHKNYRCLFYINGVENERIKKEYSIHYNEYLTYKEVIQQINNSDYILELVDENQIGNTLRFKEAICYNKYLITNNTDYSNHSFDSTNGIITFTDACEIKEKINNLCTCIDYKYSGEFSPLKLVESVFKDS
ncbi:MAG: hypothetical protein J5525_05885 [Lachnospiraceae bacterium]|nr:hypothetical protein [Lachnospiraceae bacterium]